MSRRKFATDEVLTLLAQGPHRIAESTAGMTPELLHTAPGEGEWSTNDVLAHLRSCADVWGGCIRTILTEDRATIRAMDPRTWTTKTNYLQLEFGPSLRAFTEQRAELLAILEALPPEAWSRSATVTGAGNALERTVLFYAQWLARHERTHVKQIARIASLTRS